MADIELEGFVATTDPIPAYGGVTLTPETMDSIAESFRVGDRSLYLGHDETHPVPGKVLSAEVRPTERGTIGVWIKFVVDEQEWVDAGSPCGLSVAVIGDPVQPVTQSGKAPLILAADAGHFTDEEYRAAVAQLEKYFAVGGGRLYQFSVVVPAKVILDMFTATLQAIPPNLLSSVLYDALKHFLRRNGSSPTVFSFSIKDGERSVDAHLETNSTEVLRDALDGFYKLAQPEFQGKVVIFEERRRGWLQLGSEPESQTTNGSAAPEDPVADGEALTGG